MLYIIGVGPGDPELITVKGLNILRSVNVVAGWGSVLDRFSEYLINKRVIKLSYRDEAEGLKELITSAVNEDAALLMHGDPSVSESQLMAKVTWLCREYGVTYEVVPGVSSVNAVLGMLGIDLDSSVLISLHVRGSLDDRLEELKTILRVLRRYIIVLPPPYPHGPLLIAKALLDLGCDPEVTIIEKATYNNQRITRTRASGMISLGNEFSDLTIMVIPPCSRD
ncbi:precorrin-6y C5,15-methyltransferase (decarboxylating) subunit CbiE [Vulcanisaeta distributa]|uniref:Precorrin-6y C5,15-methyltransferase (Decarboxylating), CbiE subunit n=1 Tax=Vulcanisaeta distributa (strain DSM 14429 / JCM 11212 / NBRC 100878 / IC-017) TaxID=572478 RepID=E1QNJ9_VULDI|nr:precorrin-6y C5,15-methyltransferase (decarboxylating) subunit CbiE [Vulcanisaeta distributa]ADN51287.1 precorrin-6y C5,15-methyltransferase (decarboxylating), CbiE subunit [Vulcanisaeta distributa DSM 14429]